MAGREIALLGAYAGRKAPKYHTDQTDTTGLVTVHVALRYLKHEPIEMVQLDPMEALKLASGLVNAAMKATSDRIAALTEAQS